jgi:prolyl-tRNA synthetase
MGGLIMIHGDDQGLRLPPHVAPIQAVIVPIFKSDAEKSAVMAAADRIFAQLKAAGIKVKLDDREETPGFKFNDWEMRGVPVRVEIGPKDVEKSSVALARRDMPGKAGKSFVPQEGLVERIQTLFDEIHSALHQQADAFLKSNIRPVHDYAALKEAVQDGWALVPLKDDPAVDAKLKEDMQATNRNFPFDQEKGEWKCVVTGETVTERALVGKAY